MKLNECFCTVQGEGLWSGTLTTFVRFAGCSLHCPKCDTMYSWSSEGSEDIGVPVVLERILAISQRPRNICITGGEPLEQPQNEMFALLQALLNWNGARGLESIVIETNGSRDVGFLRNKPFRSITHLSIDYKLPSTGKTDKMLMSNYNHLNKNDVVKFICRDPDDFTHAVKFMDQVFELDTQPVMLFHCEGGTPQTWLPRALIALDDKYNQRFQLRAGVQLHKLVEMK